MDKYFSGTTNFIFFHDLSLPSASVALPKILALYLKDLELSKATFKRFPALFIGDSSLLNCHKLPEESA